MSFASAKTVSPMWVQSQFQLVQGMLNGERTSPFYQLRQSAFKTLTVGGLPTTADEEWRHTDVVPFISKGCVVAAEAEVSLEQAEKLFGGELPAQRVVLVNGFVQRKLSTVSSEGAASTPGISIVSLAEILSGHADAAVIALVEQQLAKAQSSMSGFSALNSAFMRDGVVVLAERQAKAREPLHIVHISLGEARTLICPRVLLFVRQQAELEVVEHFVAAGNTSYARVAVTEIIAERASSCRHYKVQNEAADALHVGILHAQIERDARFTTFTLNCGGGVVRNEIQPVLCGENISCLLHGISAANGTQHIDNNTVLDHAMPHCESTEIFKGIYSGKAAGVFSGTIIVRPDAQKTNAIQSNQSILLSKDASIESKPQLKIWADDVKCTHGATVGELDAEQLFYLRARGIGYAEARKMLVQAFASALLSEIPTPSIRSQIEGVLDNKLGLL